MFEEAVSVTNKIIWSPALVVLLIAAGLYFSFRTRLVQVRRFRLMLKSLFSAKVGEDGISSFEAFCIALSGRVGTGNIVGVATAIAFGGPGAVFW
ncbi:MAG: sodium:alanine symporter family protein, partial [Bacteroidales bacterium]|nr:sodium:alanine symporter family protein [Bacteroidales bacterium]